MINKQFVYCWNFAGSLVIKMVVPNIKAGPELASHQDNHSKQVLDNELGILTVKVNGQDLSKASHDEAVAAFQCAQEPIIVEVLRRNSNNKTHCHSNTDTHKSDSSSGDNCEKNNNNDVNNSKKMKARLPTLVSTATQTDECIDNNAPSGVHRSSSPPRKCLNTAGLYQPASRQPVVFSPTTDMGLTDIEMANGFEYEDQYNYDDDNLYEMEYEEVVLHRTSDEEKIGLTLTYTSAEDDETDIFISEIEPYSIAAQDGRIREGDQILQINSCDVHSRDEAIRLFSLTKSDIKLVLARPQQLQMDDGFMDGRSYLDELHMEMLEQQHGHHMEFTSSYLSQIDEEGTTTDTGTTENSHKHEKDSGVGRTDESTKNEESSEQELLDSECLTPNSTGKGSRLRADKLHYSNDSFTSNDTTEQDFPAANDISSEDCDKFLEALETRCSNVEESREGSPMRASMKASQTSLDHELELLNKEMANISMECEEIVEAHIRHKERLSVECVKSEAGTRSPRLVPRMGTKLDYSKLPSTPTPGDQVEDVKADFNQTEEETGRRSVSPQHTDILHVPKLDTLDNASNTSSAYNTAESCHSTPSATLTLELSKDEKMHKGSMLSLAHTPSYQSDSDKTTQTQKSSRRAKRSSHNKNNDREKSDKDKTPINESDSATDYAKYADVMYTNEANLQHTMAIQQKLFEQKISQRGKSASMQSIDMSEYHAQVNKNVCSKNNTGNETANSEMEWVVKRRADGTRYVTRRAVRSMKLKERAKKIHEDRSGLTTDDDAMSELKVGRYWSKEDRKRHMERAKDHRRRKEYMMKSKLESLKEKDESKKNDIVELSHRKMQRCKGKRALDNFTTVQEMLVHGNRGMENKPYNPLLSVTTV